MLATIKPIIKTYWVLVNDVRRNKPGVPGFESEKVKH